MTCPGSWKTREVAAACIHVQVWQAVQQQWPRHGADLVLRTLAVRVRVRVLVPVAGMHPELSFDCKCLAATDNAAAAGRLWWHR